MSTMKDISKELYNDSIKLFTDSNKEIAKKLIDKYGNEFSFDIFLHSALTYSMTNYVGVSKNKEETYEIIQSTFDAIKKAVEFADEK